MWESTALPGFGLMRWGLLLVAALLVIGGWLWGRRRLYVLSFQLPGPFALPFIGNGHQLNVFGSPQRMIYSFLEMLHTYDGFWRLWLGPKFCVVLANVEDMQQILMNKAASWKGPEYEIITAMGMGEGLLTLSGDRWKLRRNIINPSFSLKTTRGYQGVYNKHARHLVDGMEELCDKGVVSLVPPALRFGGDVICESLFDWNTRFYEGDKDHILHLTPWSAELTHERVVKLWLKSDFMYRLTTSGQHFYHQIIKYRAFYDDTIRGKAIQVLKSANKNQMKKMTEMDNELGVDPSNEFEDEERKKNVTNKSVFGAMMDSVIAGHCSVDDVVDEFNNIYVPGMDTLYSQLCSFLMMMGINKRCQDILWRELKDYYKENMDADVTPEDLSNLTYLDYCFKESIRLFPTGAIQLRQLHSDFYLSTRNITLPAGTCVILSPFMLHRYKKYWKDPNDFIPERFTPEEVAKRPNFSYLPFSAGQRNCIGQKYGLDVLKTGAIYLLRKFEFHSNEKMEGFPYRVDISIRCEIGYNLKVTRRN